MADGIYTALSGAMATSRQLEVVSNNLANVNTAGFKGEKIVFKEVLAKASRGGKTDKTYVLPSGIAVDHSGGPLKQTDRQLDLAIEGEGFFTVKTPKGLRLTRNGIARVSTKGVLVNNAGHPFINVKDKKPILVPNPEEPVNITEEGIVMNGEEEIGQLLLMKASAPEYLKKEAGQYFIPNAKAGIKASEDVKLLNGYIEQSNVNPVTGMTELIEVERHFELTTKAIQVYEQINQLAASKLGSTR